MHQAASSLLTVEIVGLSENVIRVNVYRLFDHCWFHVPHIHKGVVLFRHVLDSSLLALDRSLFALRTSVWLGSSGTEICGHRRFLGRPLTHHGHDFVSGLLSRSVEAGRPGRRIRIFPTSRFLSSTHHKRPFTRLLIIKIRPIHLIPRHPMHMQVTIPVVLYFLPRLLLTHFLFH